MRIGVVLNTVVESLAATLSGSRALPSFKTFPFAPSGRCAPCSDDKHSTMLVTAFLAALLPYLPRVFADEDQQMFPFDFFLGQENEELPKEIPLAFGPEDGINYRRSYEGKYGRRGERLIALLGGGAAPLSIFDASMFGEKTPQTSRNIEEQSTTSATEQQASGSQEVTVKVEAESNSTETTAPSFIDDNASTAAPQDSSFGNRKYVTINRRKDSDDFMQNIIPQKESYSLSPDGVIYKRLYGAVWNFGEKGLQRRFPPSFLPTSTWPFLPAPFDRPGLVELPGVNRPTGEATKSESTYAGPGEPSIVVQSYSYTR